MVLTTRMVSGSAGLFLAWVASPILGGGHSRTEYKSDDDPFGVMETGQRDYLRRLDSASGREKLRSSLMRLRERLESGVGVESQGERSVPRASDIWRNKVKDFLAARIPGSSAPAGSSALLPPPQPSTFLSPPGGNILVGDGGWRDKFETETEETVGVWMDRLREEEDVETTTKWWRETFEKYKEETSTERPGTTTQWSFREEEQTTEDEEDGAGTNGVEEQTTERREEQEEQTTERRGEDEEERDLGNKESLASLQKYAESHTEQVPVTKCQTADDCKSNQVCYLPTNTCKDQLTFSLSQRSSCTKASDCNSNEVCYLNTKTCVCALDYTEVGGACVSIKSVTCCKATGQDCTRANTDLKTADTNKWTVHPYCEAWGVKANTDTKVSFGTYLSGTGLTGDPMLFSEGDSDSCDSARTANMQYSCYCDEYSCTTEPAYNATGLWWGEFDPCTYSAYIFTPLACSTKVA